MPTQTFLNLSKEKKDKIIKSAIKEFASQPFSEASINKIIKNAEISRGSFYTYFADKYELLTYLLELFREKLISNLYVIHPGKKLELEEIVFTIHHHFFDLCADEIYKKFLANILIYFFGRPEDEISRIKDKHHFPTDHSKLLEVLDMEQFKFDSVIMINKTVDISLAILNNVLFTSVIHKLSYNDSRELLESYMQILKEGYGRN
jgi:AcrR family transcriptional regulator